jgi:integrase
LTAKLELTEFAPDSEIRSSAFHFSFTLDCATAPPILTGPVVVDARGVPRYAATIWIDFLHGVRAASTKQEYRQAAAALYEQCEACEPPIALDAALLEADLPAVERALSALMLKLQLQSTIASNSQWQLARKFAFDLLGFAEVDSEAMRRRLGALQGKFNRLRPARARPPAPVRAISSIALEDLHEVFHPLSDRNPFRTEALRWRNFLIFMLLLHLGLRSGELLGLSAGAVACEFSSVSGTDEFWVDVEIDALVDSRSKPASLKNATAVRQLPLAPELANLWSMYLTNFRGDPEHGFLFSSQESRPLSSRTLGQILEVAQDSLSDPAKRAMRRSGKSSLSAHDFRHTSAVVRLQRYRDAGFTLEEAIERLRPFFGWARTLTCRFSMHAHTLSRAFVMFGTNASRRHWARYAWALGLSDVERTLPHSYRPERPCPSQQYSVLG